MATSVQTIRRLTIESRTVGVDETSQKLVKLGQAQDNVADASGRAAQQSGAYEKALASQQRSIDLANQAYIEMARDRAALAASMQQQVAANDNASRSFAGTGLEVAEVAGHLRTAATAAYTFSPAFRNVVNEMAAPALRGAGVALVAVAGGMVTATNLAGSGLVRLGTAAATIGPSFAPVAAGITAAGTAMQAFSPSLTGVAASILGRFMPALRLLGAVGFVVNAAKTLGDAWELGGQQLERYREIAERAAKVDLSTTYFQRLTKGAEDSKMSVDGLTTALTTLQKQSADQLGGSALQNRLNASVKAGNFAGNTGVQEYAQANTTQQRYEAIVSLINQAMTAGQRLAALDIAGTAFGPEVVENLRKDSEYFDKLNAAAAKVAEKDIVSPEDVGRALDLQRRYDAAVAILETRWHPVQDLLTKAGVEFHANWVATVETIANGVDWATKLVAKLGDVPSWFQKKLNEGSQWVIDNTTTPESRAAAEKSFGISSDPAEMAKGTDAYSIAVNKLRAGLQDQAEQQRKVAEANTIAQKTLGDTSKEIDNQKKKTEEAADAYDRALETVTKHTARLEADARAVGLGAGAQEEFRARTQLTTAAQLAGRDMTAELTAEIDKQAKAAGAAGLELAKLKLNDNINFGRQTALLSPEDAQIASQLRGLYPDVATGLASVEAAGLRTNAALSGLSSTASSTLVSGFADILDGTKSVSQGFADMSKSILRAIEEALIKAMIVAPIMRALQSSFGGFLGVDAGSAASYGPITLGSPAGPTAFANGGYTGAGSKYQPAGVVHAGEYVFSQASVGRIGLGNLDRLHRGYADGGPVMPMPHAANSNAAPSFTVNLIEDSSKAGQVHQSSNSDGSFNVDAYVDSIQAKNLANPGSASSQVMAQRGRLASR